MQHQTRPIKFTSSLMLTTLRQSENNLPPCCFCQPCSAHSINTLSMIANLQRPVLSAALLRETGIWQGHSCCFFSAWVFNFYFALFAFYFPIFGPICLVFTTVSFQCEIQLSSCWEIKNPAKLFAEHPEQVGISHICLERCTINCQMFDHWELLLFPSIILQCSLQWIFK